MILFAKAAYYDYEIWKMDVKIAFLNGYLEENVYMVYPEDFVDQKHPDKGGKLKRYIYGLNKASRNQNHHFNDKITKSGFVRNKDESLFT